jgi:hypothetical protein
MVLIRTELCHYNFLIQGVTEISALILTDNRTHQKEQLFLCHFGETSYVMA